MVSKCDVEFSSALGGKGNSINFEENTDFKCEVHKSHASPLYPDVYCGATMPHLHVPRARLSLKTLRGMAPAKAAACSSEKSQEKKAERGGLQEVVVWTPGTKETARETWNLERVL